MTSELPIGKIHKELRYAPESAYTGKLLPKEFFDLQFTFAQKWAELSGLPLADTVIDRTGMSRVFARTKTPSQASIDHLRTLVNDADDPSSAVYSAYAAVDKLDRQVEVGVPQVLEVFGARAYEIKNGAANFHFLTEMAGPSPFSRNNLLERLNEISMLMRHLVNSHPEIETIRSASWLNSHPHFRALFPRHAAIASIMSPSLGMTGMALWGQFLGSGTTVNEKRADAFLAKIDTCKTTEDIMQAFPMPVQLVDETTSILKRYYPVDPDDMGWRKRLAVYEDDKQIKELTFGYLSNLYTELVERGYFFRTFSQEKGSDKTILLRHDIDFSITRLAEMAKMEAQLGIRSTYFVLTDTPHYSLDDKANQRQLQDLVQAGHEIGLHFDPSHVARRTGDPKLLKEEFLKQKDDLEAATGITVTSFSLHKPEKTVLQADFAPPELLNAYDYATTSGSESMYITDSGGRWRFGDPLERISHSRPQLIQLLIHPIWWGATHITPQAKIDSLFDEYEQSVDIASILELNSKITPLSEQVDLLPRN